MFKKKSQKENFEKKKLIKEQLVDASKLSENELFVKYDSSIFGKNSDTIELSREKYGSNAIAKAQKTPLYKRLFDAFFNPFTAILILIVIISLINDVIFTEDKNYTTIIVIVAMVMLSGILKFVQETRSGNAAEKLLEMVETTIAVKRDGERIELPLDEIVVGDIIHLSAGDIVPSDCRVISSKDLFISQSSLTGESIAIEKTAFIVPNKDIALTEIPNLCFMGSNVISGSAIVMAIITGNDTLLGQVAKAVSVKKEATGFEKGINSVSWILIKFMMFMVPVVFFVNGITKSDWVGAFLFAISIAVGLTPEMLPMIVTTCLAKGAVSMSKKKTIIKKLDSIQNFGSINILCTDKTGTLTQDRVVLEQHLDVDGKDDIRVLRHAFLNSYFQTGLKNIMDLSIIEKTYEHSETDETLKKLAKAYEKVDEIPFDFARRRMSVVVRNLNNNKTQMITKGAVEEILNVCKYVEYNGIVEELSDQLKQQILRKVESFNEQGHRVIAIAQKSNPSKVEEFGVKDECEMVLIGYLTFLDPPKDSTKAAIKSLHEYGVDVKVLTGDNEKVTIAICNQVGIKTNKVLLGNDIEKMNDEALFAIVETVNIFAKLSPDQKARVVRALRHNGHIVGYMGDGINDAPAMKASDVGISVESAVDIAKESADVILLEKDLNVLENGIIEGRKTFANMIKYIKMTASSNFGNMFSVLIASAFLPFLPMAPVHLILLNLVYDISCAAIPWDNVDNNFIEKPKKWDASSVGKFMLWIGPTSSLFDITTYLLMFFIICPSVFGGNYFSLDANTQIKFMMMFQAGWFIESMWTQSFVIHMIRTPKIPFIQSRASKQLFFSNLFGITILTLIPFTFIGKTLGFIAPPLIYFAWLLLTIILYMLLATLLKKIYIKRYKELL